MIRKLLPSLVVLGALVAAPACTSEDSVSSTPPDTDIASGMEVSAEAEVVPEPVVAEIPAPPPAPEIDVTPEPPPVVETPEPPATSPTAVPDAAVPDVAGAIALGVKAKKGDAFRFKSTFKTVVSMGGMVMNDVDMQSVVRMDVEEVAENGNLTVKVTHEHIKGEMKSPMMGDASFDSNEAPDESNAMAAQVTPAFTLFTKGPIQLTLKPDGVLLELTGAAELFQEHLGDSPMAAMLAAQYANDMQKVQFQGSFVRYAPEALPVGGTWKIESTDAMGPMTVTTIIDNELTSNQDGEVTIVTTSTASDETMGLSTKTTSTATVSATDGMLVSATSSTSGGMASQGFEQTIESSLTRIGLDEVVVAPKKPEAPAEAPNADAPAQDVDGPGVDGPGETRDGETRDDG